jgi:hypothetical protein
MNMGECGEADDHLPEALSKAGEGQDSPGRSKRKIEIRNTQTRDEPLCSIIFDAYWWKNT